MITMTDVIRMMEKMKEKRGENKNFQWDSRDTFQFSCQYQIQHFNQIVYSMIDITNLQSTLRRKII